MSGIQISGLLANSAFDWKSIVDQLIAADSIPVTTLTKEQDTNTQKIAALDTLKTSLTDLQDSVQSMRAGDVFSARTVSSNVANTTWKSSSVTGAAVGSYTIAVQQLAAAAKLQGAIQRVMIGDEQTVHAQTERFRVQAIQCVITVSRKNRVQMKCAFHEVRRSRRSAKFLN